MIEDMTEKLRRELSNHFAAQMLELAKLKLMFGPATASAALGELSELLVMNFIGASRPIKRNNPGHDLILGDETIEVKSRDISHWSDRLMFDFGAHTKKATTAFCLVWVWQQNKPLLAQAFKLPVSFLVERWGGKLNRYCARTSLGKLRKAVAENAR